MACFIAADGCEALGDYVEVQTGEGADALDRCPRFAAALATSRDAYSVVVKLDRPSRDAHFITGLMA